MDVKKLLILDIDGVVIKSDILYSDIALNCFSHNVVLSDMKRVVTSGGQPLFDLVTNGASCMDNIEIFRKMQTELLDAKTHLFPGVSQTVSELSELFNFAVLSNKPQKVIMEILQKCDLDEYFSLVIGLDSGFNKKPSSDGLAHILNQIDHSEAFFVGDAYSDWLSTIGLDVKFIYASYGFDNQPQKYPHCISDFRELLDLLG